LASFQSVTSFVDLVEAIAIGYQLVKRELPLPIPAQVHFKVSVWVGGSEAGDETTLRAEKMPRIKTHLVSWHTNEDCRAT